jgi:hypothetical protein
MVTRAKRMADIGAASCIGVPRRRIRIIRQYLHRDFSPVAWFCRQSSSETSPRLEITGGGAQAPVTVTLWRQLKLNWAAYIRASGLVLRDASSSKLLGDATVVGLTSRDIRERL